MKNLYAYMLFNYACIHENLEDYYSTTQKHLGFIMTKAKVA